MKAYQFELKGSTPLLMHSDDLDGAEKLKAWRTSTSNSKISKAGDDRSPPWTWQTYLYSDGENIVMPSRNLMTCLRKAGAKVILKKQTTFKELTQNGMFCADEYLDFLVSGKKVSIESVKKFEDEEFETHTEKVKPLGFSLFSIRAKIGASKHVRVRPRFDNWMVRGRFNVLAKELTKDRLKEIFDLAGMVGLGDWRPGCSTPGPYGMFDATIKEV